MSLPNNNSSGAACSINMKECDHALDTSRGIHPGSSWDDFVRAYGDRIASEIKADSNTTSGRATASP